MMLEYSLTLNNILTEVLKYYLIRAAMSNMASVIRLTGIVSGLEMEAVGEEEMIIWQLASFRIEGRKAGLGVSKVLV
jgi:hypothetical protein